MENVLMSHVNCTFSQLISYFYIMDKNSHTVNVHIHTSIKYIPMQLDFLSKRGLQMWWIIKSVRNAELLFELIHFQNQCITTKILSVSRQDQLRQ